MAIFDARGRVDQEYQVLRRANKAWSTLIFPEEKPPTADLRLCGAMLGQLQEEEGQQQGAFISSSHKLWPWRYDEAQQRLSHFNGERRDVYTPATHTARPNSWRYEESTDRGAPEGDYCTVERRLGGLLKILAQTQPEENPPDATTLMEVFQQWGCAWIWEDLRWQGYPHWLRTVIKQVSCIAVTDGSYMPDINRQLCSTAFFFNTPTEVES